MSERTRTESKPSPGGSARPGTLNINDVKADFPILQQQVNGHRIVYLDSAASSQKPQVVIDTLCDYYRNYNSNIHRGLHTLAERATQAYEDTRTHVASFIGGVTSDEIIFTSGTTEAINLVAYTWGEQNIAEGDEIVLTEMEHHANFVPWVLLARRKKATIRRIPITVDGTLDMAEAQKILTPRTKLLALSHMSNVLGTINPVRELTELAHAHGAVVLCDGAQSVPHLPVDVPELGVDFYAFSSHKMLGPTGVGVLYGQRELLEKMPPFLSGGEMIVKVSLDEITFNELPHKFEAGTPNIGDVIAFNTALNYLETIGMEAIRNHEIELTEYALSRLSEIEGISTQGPRDVKLRGGAISFTDDKIHPHDIGTFLDSQGIAIRAGHHCAQPLMRVLGTVATARASLYIYNDEADVDTLADGLCKMKRYFGS
ncbi:MAG: cysteine desulfurase [Candidatus Zixiibacteriota bacterium]